MHSWIRLHDRRNDNHMLYGFAQKNRADWWILASTGWIRENQGVLVCASCGSVLTNNYPAAINVQLSQLPKKRSLGSVSPCSIGVMRLDLLDMLRPYFVRVAVGKCLNESGDELPTHISFYSDQTILLRGGSQCEWHTCVACNRVLYQPKGRTARYILGKYITGQDVYMDERHRVYISERLYQKFKWTQFRDQELYTIPILDTPIDGKVLPGDPPEWASIVPPEHARR